MGVGAWFGDLCITSTLVYAQGASPGKSDARLSMYVHPFYVSKNGSDPS